MGMIEGSEDGTVKQEQKETKEELYRCDEGGHAAVDVTKDPEGELAPQTREQTKAKEFYKCGEGGHPGGGRDGTRKGQEEMEEVDVLVVTQ